MHILNITSQLLLKSYDSEQLIIHTKQGKYNSIVENGELTIVRNNEDIILELVNWEHVGERDYASIGSDLRFISISDKKCNEPSIELDWLDDNVQNFYQNGNRFIFEIPCGSGGALSVYVAKNEKGEIVGVKFNGLHPDDM